MPVSRRVVQSAAEQTAQTRVRNAHREAVTGAGTTVVVFQHSSGLGL